MATNRAEQLETIEQLLGLLSTRMSWTMGSKLVEQAGLRKSRGWPETVSASARTLLNEQGLLRAEGMLRIATEQHALVGEKVVAWYDWKHLKADARSSLRTWIRNVDPRTLPRSKRPFDVLSLPWRQADLRPIYGGQPELVSAARGESRLTLLFFSVRSYTMREEIDISSFPPAQRARFNDYLEVIGLKARNLPCLDVVVFDLANNRTEIRIDHQVGMKSDGEEAAYTSILEQVNRVIFGATQHMPMGLGLVDFFPAVDSLYRDISAGLVEYLGFVATAQDKSSNNSGKVHRRAGQDLRVDPFHVGGRRAVATIEPYTIGVSADSLSGLERLQLELNGSVRMILGARRTGIAQAGFHGCATTDDYAFLTSLLEDHLPRAEARTPQAA